MGVDLKCKWMFHFLIRISRSPRSFLFFVNLIFSLYVDMFCHCVKSYDTCYTSVPVRSFPCLSYYRNEQYALVDRIENRLRAAGILTCVQSSWLSDFRALCWIAQVSSKLRKATLNSLNVCCFSLWVVTTTTTCILLMTGKPFSTITMRRLFVTVSSYNIVSHCLLSQIHKGRQFRVQSTLPKTDTFWTSTMCPS